MTTTVVHLIQHLSTGGASRALIALAKHSARLGPFRHQAISLLPVDDETSARARDAGLDVLAAPETPTLHRALAAADIVQVHWWNNPELNAFLHTNLPAMRLVVWYHVSGHAAPQVITPDLVRFADLNIATNPWTYAELPVFRDLPAADRDDRLALIIDPADLDRVETVTPRPHDGFQIGYIGTVDFVKMHPDFVALSASVRIPEARFIVCGHGAEDVLREQARRLGAEARFDFRGYVEDIRPVLETLDVYGYPLCPDTYASGELNLQEVMRAGVPPVVFPHGGIRGLIDHDRTGLVVHNATEYRDAIEHLHRVPEDRRRLGQAAAAHAREHFGAAHAARQLHPLYQRLLELPKRQRSWGTRPGEALLHQPVSLFEISRPPGLTEGARLFLESLGDTAAPFVESLLGDDPRQTLRADRTIAHSSRLLRSSGCGGIAHYRRQFDNDPWLRYWNGLVSLNDGRLDEARAEFSEAFRGGCHRGRAAWRYHQAATTHGHPPPLPPEMSQSLCDWLEATPDASSPHTDDPAANPAADPEFGELLAAAARLRLPPPPPSPQPQPPVPAPIASAAPHPPGRRPQPQNPADLSARFAALAAQHLKSGNAPEARDCLERALELTPNTPPLLEVLGRLYRKLGDHAAADAVRQRLLALAGASTPPVPALVTPPPAPDEVHTRPNHPAPTVPTSDAPAGHRPRSYGADWDSYVQNHRHMARAEPTNHGRTDLVYPGDEWGRPEEWRAFAHRFLRPYLPPHGGGTAVELGQGSGKYTLEILDLTRQVVCFDVSQAFLDVAQQRLAEHIDSGHVALEKLGLKDCNEILHGLAARGLVGHVDLFFSIDAMVHVELHTLFAYLVTASHALKMDGHLVLTVASCTSAGGYQRLIEETPWYYGGGRPGHPFYFLSPDIVRHLCRQLGFVVVQLEEGRDISFAARKIAPPQVHLKSFTR